MGGVWCWTAWVANIKGTAAVFLCDPFSKEGHARFTLIMSVVSLVFIAKSFPQLFFKSISDKNILPIPPPPIDGEDLFGVLSRLYTVCILYLAA